MRIKNILLTVAASFLFYLAGLSQEMVSLPVEGIKTAGANVVKEGVITDPATGSRIVFNVVEPGLQLFKPEGVPSNGVGVLVCPGGAFHILAYDDEGVKIAKALAAKGYTAAVLKYRLVALDPRDPFGKLMQNTRNLDTLETIMAPVVPLAVEDGKAAMKYLKEHAPALNIDAAKVGVVGFSAGGTIAAALALERGVLRPFFSAPVYPYLAPVLKIAVPPNPTPIFIAVTADDDFGFDANALVFYQNWKKAKGLADLHLYSKGRHGFASKQQGLPVDNWPERFFEWLSVTALKPNASITLHEKMFEWKNVKGTVLQMEGETVLKVERDLKALPFSEKALSSTVDEATFAKLKDLPFENGSIELKVMSRIQNPSPFKDARGFIGVAFRIANQDSAFESIYLRPSNGRVENQFMRNHTVQYYSYPHYKFDRLRRESPGVYETYADVGLNEWITLRIEVSGPKAILYINNQPSPSFVVEKLKRSPVSGSIGFWVDIGTEGYFKDVKVINRD